MRDKTTGALVAANAVALLFAAWYVAGVGAVWMTVAGISFGWITAMVWAPSGSQRPSTESPSTEEPT